MGNIHYYAIAAAVIAAGSSVTLAGAWIGRQIKGWRTETTQAIGTLAGMFGDWIDDVEERLQPLEQANGVRPRPRRAPRRIEAMAKGFDVRPTREGHI